MPTGKNYCFGLFDPTGQLYAVAVYGTGVNPYQAKFLGARAVIELKRMARREPREDFPLSRFIAVSLRMLRKAAVFDVLVSFSDPEQGHEGTLYKASGFSYAGLTNPEWHLVDSAGVKRHRRYAYRYAKRRGITLAQARGELGVSRIKTAPKHRWVKRL